MRRLWTLAALALVGVPASFAHHSMSEFDRGVIEEVEGIVSRVSWKNPHILLEVTNTDANGAEAIYYFDQAWEYADVELTRSRF